MRHATPQKIKNKKQKAKPGHCVWYNRSRSGIWTETDIGSIRWFLHDACKGCHLPHSDREKQLAGGSQLTLVALTSCAEAEEADEEKETYPNGRWFLKKGVEQVLKWRHRWITTPKRGERSEQTEGGANNNGSGKRTKYHSKQQK